MSNKTKALEFISSLIESVQEYELADDEFLGNLILDLNQIKSLLSKEDSELAIDPEKQIPKYAMYGNDQQWHCPRCGGVTYTDKNRCRRCGQKLMWPEQEQGKEEGL